VTFSLKLGISAARLYPQLRIVIESFDIDHAPKNSNGKKKNRDRNEVKNNRAAAVS
jgi:hypothetical protein